MWGCVCEVNVGIVSLNKKKKWVRRFSAEFYRSGRGRVSVFGHYVARVRTNAGVCRFLRE